MTSLVKINRSNPNNTTFLSFNKEVKCYFCEGNHICRDCPLEANIAKELKKKVGIMMEHYVADNLNCPECGEFKKLKVIGNHSPSLDIICSFCNKKFEVKSKCLTTYKLPIDIQLPHGSHNDYMCRLEEDLNLIVIIYGVDRVKKLINIREVLYANNKNLKTPTIVEVLKRDNNNLSTIMIKNKSNLSKLNLQTNNTILSFKNDVEIYKKYYKLCN